MTTPQDPQPPMPGPQQPQGQPPHQGQPPNQGQQPYPGQQGQQPYPGQQGQQPYPGQQGQQPYPGQQAQQAQQGQQPYPGGQPHPPADNKKRNIIIAVVAVLMVVAIGGYVWYSQSTGTVNAAAGDCVKVIEASATNAETEPVDCGDPQASYVVVETGEGITCGPNEAQYTEEGNDTKVCLAPNWEQGDCVKLQNTSNGDDFEMIDCADATAQDGEVVLVDKTKADESLCDAQQLALPFPKRALTFCLAPATAS